MTMILRKDSDTGRELDRRWATLSGEAADLKVKHPEPRGNTTSPVPVWRQDPSLQAADRQDYYRLPVLKQPVWIWSVPAYFYVGGVAGGAAVLAALLKGRRRLRDLASACRWLAFLGTTLGPGLLTWDLGKMQRFANMLRVLRPSSPMSIGSWSLAGSGALSALALLRGEREGGRLPELALAGGGLVLAGYTGVLLGNTANPLWKGCRNSLPLLFTASSMASTAGVLELLPLNRDEEKVVQHFGLIGKVAETASLTLVERQAARNPQAARGLSEGEGGLLWKTSKALITAGVILNLIPVRSPWKRRLGGLLTTAGAVCLRYALLESGKQAAREPQATFSPQRRTT